MKPKGQLLLVFTGLVLAHARWFAQYGDFPWGSVMELLGAWLLHYFIVLLIVGFSYAASVWASDRYLGGKRLSVDQATIYFSLCILVSAALMFVFAVLPGPDLHSPDSWL